MGILSGLFGGDHSGDVKRMMEENQRLYGTLELPEFDEYNPELYDNESANYQLASDDPALKAKQLEALSQFGDLSQEGLSDTDKAVFAQARSQGDQMARQGTQAAMQDAQVRGVAGGGQEFALREAANQAGAQRANEAATQQAAASAQARQTALQAYANQGNQMQNQATNLSTNNSNVINDFNKLNTTNRNTTNQANVGAKNDAVKYNQGQQQQTFNNNVTKIGGQTGANTGMANAYAAQGAANQANENQLLQLAGTGAAAYLGRK